MDNCRVEIIDGSEFNPREWLRRELLWAYLMVPYSEQIEEWRNGSAYYQHSGNSSRQALFALRQGDPEAQSMSYFNQGKNVAGMINTSALFKAMLSGYGEGGQVNVLKIQADKIDKALGMVASGNSLKSRPEAEVYEECADIVRATYISRPNAFGNNYRLLKASRLMSGLVVAELSSWLAGSIQNEANSLPHLTIYNGGHARSVGPRVDMLTPLHQKVIESAQFQAFAS